MPESVVSAVRAAATLPAAAESCGTQAPTAPAAVRGPGALSRWETVRAVMRLELVAWNQVYLTTMIGLILVAQAGLVAHHWLGVVLPLPLVLVLAIFPPFLLLTLCGVVCLTLWDPSRSSGALRLYGALPLRRSELVGARWVEGVALALLSGLVCVPAAALTGDWGGLMAGLLVICLSAALGLPLFLCLAPERALWVWGLCLGAGAGALYGSTPLLAGPVTEVLREPAPAVLAALACPALLGASLVVALCWYGRHDH